MVALFLALFVALASAQMPYVAASEIDTTMKKSVAENILDTKMEEATVKGRDQIIEGSGTIVVGGRMENPRAVSDPPNLGPTPCFSGSQVGGVSQKLSPKDLVIVPAGMPHRFIQLDGPISYVIYRFEPAKP